MVVGFSATLETRKQWSTVSNILSEVFSLELCAKPHYELCVRRDSRRFITSEVSKILLMHPPFSGR